MLTFALGMLILSTLQTLSGQNFNLEPEGVCGRTGPHCSVLLYKNGTFYQVVGDNLGVNKSTVSDVMKCVNRIGEPSHSICLISKGWPDCPEQAQAFSRL